MSPAAAAVLDRGVNILIGLTKPYIWIPFTASGLTPSQISFTVIPVNTHQQIFIHI